MLYVFLPLTFFQIKDDITVQNSGCHLCPVLSHESCLDENKKIRGLQVSFTHNGSLT